jgi:hypothetical protein
MLRSPARAAPPPVLRTTTGWKARIGPSRSRVASKRHDGAEKQPWSRPAAARPAPVPQVLVAPTAQSPRRRGLPVAAPVGMRLLGQTPAESRGRLSDPGLAANVRSHRHVRRRLTPATCWESRPSGAMRACKKVVADVHVAARSVRLLGQTCAANGEPPSRPVVHSCRSPRCLRWKRRRRAQSDAKAATAAAEAAC